MSKEIERRQNVVLYSVAFRGLYGRKRKPDVTFARGYHEISDDHAATTDFGALAEDYAREVGAKSGIAYVTRHPGCEVSVYQEDDGRRFEIHSVAYGADMTRVATVRFENGVPVRG